MYYSILGTNVRILGAMHLFPVSTPIMPPWVMEAEHWAEALVVESPPGSLLQHIKASPLADLQRQVPGEIWDKLVSFWPTSGALAPLHALKPWAAALIAPQLHMQTVAGVEGFFDMSAQKNNKRLGYLESATDVEPLLHAVPLEDVISMLRYTLDDLSAPQQFLEQLYRCWRAGDLVAVNNQAAASPLFQIHGLRDAMIVGRNRAWAEQIKGILATPHRTLITVGALHLAGPGNLFEWIGQPVEALPLAISAVESAPS
jgi:uncharacterized protein YbaP (TraB family)